MTLVLIFPTNLLFSITLSEELFLHRCRIFRFQTLLGHTVLSLYARETTFYVHWSASSVNNLNLNLGMKSGFTIFSDYIITAI